MPEQLYEIENGIVIHIPTETKKITEGVKESFYFLHGLLELETIYSSLSPNSKSKISEGIQAFRDEADKIESELVYIDANKQLATFPDHTKLKELYKKYILLKERIDKYQLDVLGELFEVLYQTLSKITGTRDHLKQLSAQIYTSLVTKSAFIHSHNEDKKNTYFLIVDTETFDKTVNPYEKYFHVEVSDYSFKLYRDRTRFQHLCDNLLQLIFSISDIDNKRNLDILIQKQYSLNKQMVLLTYVITALTIITVIVSIIHK